MFERSVDGVGDQEGTFFNFSLFMAVRLMLMALGGAWDSDRLAYWRHALV